MTVTVPPTVALSARVRTALTAAGLDPAQVQRVARQALEEDLAAGEDVTSVATVEAAAEGTARFVTRGGGVVAGLPVAVAVLEVAAGGPVTLEEAAVDGDRVAAGALLATARAPVRALLLAERSALNLLCHLSGIATLTRVWVDAVAGTGAVIRDTRKTTPGLRALEKYAVRCGGGVNHRMSLSESALVKDNHVLAAGGVGPALAAVRARHPGLEVEVECDTAEQVEQALSAGAELVLLDNMAVSELATVVRLVAGRARLEASGGLTLATARAVARTGVDYVSVGALTHSAPILDIGCDLAAADPRSR